MSPESSRDSSEQALDAYAAQAAHQLGEAVALMRASTTVLERGRAGGQDTRDAMRGMAAGVDRAQRFVDDLLDLTQVGRAELRLQTVDLAALVDEARAELDDALVRAKASLGAEALPAIPADRRQLRRLILHLLRVSLSAGATTIIVRAQLAAAGARLEVADDGMPPDGQVADAFAPFTKARGRGPLVGAGVSLTLCRRIAELHGGWIELDRRADGWTVTVVTLPVAEPVRVLLCDDAPELRVLLRGELESDPGIEVVGEAGDGDTAVALARDTVPDIVVLDLEMPGPEPPELLAQLRACAPAARLVTFSGHDPWMAGPGAEEHIALHVPKTTELAAVHRAILDLAHQHRAR